MPEKEEDAQELLVLSERGKRDAAQTRGVTKLSVDRIEEVPDLVSSTPSA